MRLDDEAESSNYEVRPGRGGGGFGLPIGIPLGRGGLGCGTLLLIIVVSLVFGVNPLTLLGDGSGGQGLSCSARSPARRREAATRRARRRR